MADALEWDRQEFDKSVAAIREGYEDVKAGRAQPAAEFFREVPTKYGFQDVTV